MVLLNVLSVFFVFIIHLQLLVLSFLVLKVKVGGPFCSWEAFPLLVQRYSRGDAYWPWTWE